MVAIEFDKNGNGTGMFFEADSKQELSETLKGMNFNEFYYDIKDLPNKNTLISNMNEAISYGK